MAEEGPPRQHPIFSLVGQQIPKTNTTIERIRESQLSPGMYIVKLEGVPAEVTIRLQPSGEVTGPGVDPKIIQFFQYKLNLLGVGIPIRERNFKRALSLFEEKGYPRVNEYGIKPFEFVIRFRDRPIKLFFNEDGEVVPITYNSFNPTTYRWEAVPQQIYNPETQRVEDAAEDTMELVKRLNKLLKTRSVAEMMLKTDLPQGVGKTISKYLGGRKSRRRQTRRRKTRRS